MNNDDCNGKQTEGRRRGSLRQEKRRHVRQGQRQPCYSQYKQAEIGRKEQRKVERERKAQQQIAARANMAEVKFAMDNGQVKYILLSEILHDGSRLYVLELPIKEEYKTHKKGFQRAFVRCVNSKQYNFKTDEDEEQMEYSFSYVTGHSTSFPSCSSNYAKTDEEALWEVASYLYHNW